MLNTPFTQITMFSRQLPLLCLLLPLWWWPVPTSSQTHVPPVTVVYRADTLRPDQVKSNDGFWPRGMSPLGPTVPSPDFSLYNHVRGSPSHNSHDSSGFVSTTASPDFAEQHLLDDLGASGFIYRIHVSENMVDVAASLGRYYQHPDEEEFAALAGIRWTQIMGWSEYRFGNVVLQAVNTDYQANVFDSRAAGGAQPQLAGFPRGHVAWLEEPWHSMAVCQQSDRKRHQSSNCAPKVAARDLGSAYLASVREFDSLKLHVELADDFWAGTDDAIGANLGDRDEYVGLFDAPTVGEKVTRDVDLSRVFGHPVVSLKTLSKIVLIQRPAPHPITTDDFKIKGTHPCRSVT